MPFRVSGGIDILESFIREGLDRGLITRAGAWYTYKDDKAMGLNGLKQIFIDTPEKIELLKSEILWSNLNHKTSLVYSGLLW